MYDALVTGCEGFLGKHLLAHLQMKGIASFNASRYQGDVAEATTWAKFPDAKVVYHLAAKTYVPESWHHPSIYYAANTTGILNALEYCRLRGASLIVSSAYTYGAKVPMPVVEATVREPSNPYALSKYLGEEICKFYSLYYNVNVTVLRIFNIYGVGQSSNFIIPKIFEFIRKKEPIIVNDLTPRRDFINVRDVVEALMFSAKENQNGFSVYNVGSGESHSIQEIIECIQILAGTELPVISRNETRANEILDTVADISKIYTDLQWRPKVSLTEGLNEIFKDV